MFEITPDDVALLKDDELRTLVGRLCESELKSRGFPTSAVTWGGHQNAADGGLDVRVALSPTISIEDFVPRPATGFQVKAEDMPPAKIITEMRPKGVLRPVIQELADHSGAYIIVSSLGSTSDTALERRRKAMADALHDLPNRGNLKLDFYDRTRLATWIRDHGGLILWVRELIGKSVRGWQAYGPWAYRPEGPNAEYLLDDGIRVRTGRQEHADGLQPVQGINYIRALLHDRGKVARLVGLSGVGKTRLVQALFDDRIGDHSLNPSFAFYTNMADSPDPQPMAIASDLLATRTRAVLVIDNCAPELHRRLSELCRSPESTMSVITVEYDITDDEPEGTEVYKLYPASIDLVEKLVTRRFKTVSVVDARTIAEFSGGNPRIAFALAGTIEKHGTIAGLNDLELFQRLFQQRQPHDKSLLLAAQACSLVYSFQGEDVSSGDQAELVRLGAMVGQGADEMFRNVSELLRRDLAQRRGDWRAVLPQAIADRLAATALQSIPMAAIDSQFVNGPERLLKSFSRRLGYLHCSKAATAIVENWLGVGGLLESVDDFNELGKAMFKDVAPAAPEAALSALERRLLGQQDEKVLQKCGHHVDLLRRLAYDASLFDRCIALILKIAEATNVNQESNEVRDAFICLFSILLSGTHATIEQRLQVVGKLLRSDSVKRRSLGLKALGAALEAWHFISFYNYEFGGHPRDLGYRPHTREEERHWFSSTLSLAESIASSDQASALEVRLILASKFRGLWTKAAMYDDLEHVCLAISGKQFWREGWLAVRQTVGFDSEGFTPEISGRLNTLENLLRPRNIVQKVRSIVFSKNLIGTHIGDFWDGEISDGETGFQRTMSIAEDLGRAVATDELAFAELLTESLNVEVSGDGRVWCFGRGIADAQGDTIARWERLVAQLEGTPKEQRNIQVLRGFLDGLHNRNPELVTRLLDAALKHETLATLYPALQGSVPLNDEGLSRLMASLELGKAHIGTYRQLAWGGLTESITPKDFQELVLAIASKTGGWAVAMEILSVRFIPNKEVDHRHPPEVIDTGCELLRQITFTKDQGLDDHNLKTVIEACLFGEKGSAIVRGICHKLRAAESNRDARAYDYPQLIEALFNVQATAALDALCDGSAQECKVGVRIIDDIRHHNKNPLDLLTEDELIGWCDADPTVRYTAMASLVTISQNVGDTATRQWTSTALRILERAPDRVSVLKRYIGQFTQVWGIGSQLSAIEGYTKLLDELDGYPDAAVTDFIAQEKVRMAREIEIARHYETTFDRKRDERFE
jgi:hypothetical protein